MKIGHCLLCKRNRELSVQSHIIPKFMYKGMEDGRNKIAETIVRNDLRKESEIDYRYFDKNILCIECETITLSQLDNYGNRVLFGDQKNNDSFKTSITEYSNAKVCMVDNYDYFKFKLFLISVLWRANISKQVFFDSVNLSTTRSDLIREAIIKKDAEVCSDIRISIFGLMFDRQKLFKSVAKPRHIISDDLDIYSFMIHGIVYNFIYRDSNNQFHLGENIMHPNQPLKIPFYLGIDAMNFFRALVLPKQNDMF